MKSAYDIIIRPIITEQSMEDLDIKKYVFEVARDAGKIEIKNAVEERLGAQPKGRTASWKKAVVKLSQDSKNIEIFEGMA